MIKSVVTEQASDHSGAEEYLKGKHKQPQVVHAVYITAAAIHASTMSQSFFYCVCSLNFYFPASGQAVVTGVLPSPPRFLASISVEHTVQQSHCSSILHRVLLTHALALSASQYLRKRKSQPSYMSMHSAGIELTKLTYPDSRIR